MTDLAGHGIGSAIEAPVEGQAGAKAKLGDSSGVGIVLEPALDVELAELVLQAGLDRVILDQGIRNT